MEPPAISNVVIITHLFYKLKKKTLINVYLWITKKCTSFLTKKKKDIQDKHQFVGMAFRQVILSESRCKINISYI